MDDISVIEQLFDQKILRILSIFFEEEDKEFYLREISKKADVPVASTFRIMKRLIELKLIDIVQINKFKLYKLAKNKQAEVLKNILKKDKRILDLFVDKIKELKEISQIILHGKEAKDKANILLIGGDIDASLVKEATMSIKEKFNFTISSLSLTKEQYNQMVSMGLYSGEKKILYIQDYPRET